MAKTNSSPMEKRARKAYKLLLQKAPKQNIAPTNVVAERSCKRRPNKSLVQQIFTGIM